uniref:Uncharacterized protein n=1 Tax=Cacopsylla melanoneura TaxID=428564 RepID=A0A8D8R0B6_9HEMI
MAALYWHRKSGVFSNFRSSARNLERATSLEEPKLSGGSLKGSLTQYRCSLVLNMWVFWKWFSASNSAGLSKGPDETMSSCSQNFCTRVSSGSVCTNPQKGVGDKSSNTGAAPTTTYPRVVLRAMGPEGSPETCPGMMR